MKIHRTVGVYNNGDRVTNGVRPEDLDSHIKYNLDYRFGRAFFVDGVCVNKGYLGTERCKQISEELKLLPPMDRVTLPYR